MLVVTLTWWIFGTDQVSYQVKARFLPVGDSVPSTAPCIFNPQRRSRKSTHPSNVAEERSKNREETHNPKPKATMERPKETNDTTTRRKIQHYSKNANHQ
jgi:hypothetical protein